MAEAIAAIGLASSVVQLIDFTAKVLSQASELSKVGILDSHLALQTITQDLRSLNDNVVDSLKREPTAEQSAETSDNGLKLLCIKSSEAANELLQHLEKYEYVSKSPYRSAGALRQAIKLRWKQKDLDVLTAKVESYRAATNTHLLVELRSRLANVLLDGRLLTQDEFSRSTVELKSLVSSVDTKFQQHLELLSLSTSVAKSKLLQIHNAAHNDDLLALGQLLPRNASSDLVNCLDETRRSALHVAAQVGSLPMAEFLYNRNADANLQDDQGRTPLHLAIIEDHLEVARHLVYVYRAATDLMDDDDRVPMDYASHKSITEWLLRDDVDKTGRHRTTGDTALITAARNADTESVSYLIHSAKQMLELKNGNGRSALMTACLQGDTTIINMLLDAGADANAHDNENWTPLMHCIWGKNRLEAMTVLLQSPNIDLEIAPVSRDHTVLAEAFRLCQWDAIRLLIQHGADVNTLDWEMHPLLTRAIQSDAPFSIFELMLERGANPNAAHSDGWSPAIEAMCTHHWRHLGLLIVHGLHLNIATRDGLPILSLAAIENQVELARMIVKRAPELVDNKNKYQWTALREACGHKRPLIAELLLEKGARVDDVIHYDPHDPNREGWTYLMMAAAYGQSAIALALLKHGAELEAVDKRGRTALRIAIDHGEDRTACLLLAQGADIEKADRQGVSALQQAKQAPNKVKELLNCVKCRDV